MVVRLTEWGCMVAVHVGGIEEDLLKKSQLKCKFPKWI